MERLSVKTDRPYEILIGSGLLSEAGKRVSELVAGPPRKVFLVTDDNVAPLYAGRVMMSLLKEGFEAELYSFEHGEENKTLETVSKIVSHMGVHAFDRGDLVIALGGGLAGDVAGFSAAIYERGIRFVQLPTTLLAMVDSSVGGKTGVNLKAGKNLAGAFWQPSLVLCDPDALESLPEKELSDGMAEALKTGIIRDRELFEDIERLSEEGQGNKESGAASGLEGIIRRCLEIKAEIVSEDEREAGIRAILNFGHSYGHAIELLSKYEISHGHAVAIGMAMAARAAERSGFSKEETAAPIEKALKSCGLPTECPFSAEEMLPAMLHDKKKRGDSIKLILPRNIGLCEAKEVPLSELKAYL